MRRLAPLVTAILVVFTPTDASAAERRPDPVAALKKQLVSGHGVKVVERRWTYIDHKVSRHVDWIEGVLQFNRTGVAGYDVRVKSGPRAERIRMIAIGPYAYQSGGAVTQALPKGKTWRRTASKPGRRSPFLTQMMIAEPATLKAVLATTSHFQSGVYRRTITLGELYAVSPSYRGNIANRPDVVGGFLPLPDALSQLFRKQIGILVLDHPLRVEHARLRQVGIHLHQRRLGLIGQNMDDIRGMAPLQENTRAACLMIDGTPQHLEQIRPLRADQVGHIARE